MKMSALFKTVALSGAVAVLVASRAAALTLTAPAAGAGYDWRVRGISASGQASPWSEVRSLTVMPRSGLAVYSIPDGASIDSVNVAGRSIDVTVLPNHPDLDNPICNSAPDQILVVQDPAVSCVECIA
jgi:hypothetical protein